MRHKVCSVCYLTAMLIKCAQNFWGLGQPKLIKIFASPSEFFPRVLGNAVLWVSYSKSCYEFLIEKDNPQARRRRKFFEDLGTWNVKFPLQKCVLGSQILKKFRLRRAHGSSGLIFQGTPKIEKNNYFSLGNTPKVPTFFYSRLLPMRWGTRWGSHPKVQRSQAQLADRSPSLLRQVF